MTRGRFKDLSGQKFGRLLVIKRIENKGKEVQWECLCDCGNTHNIVSRSLLHGGTKSCGCIHLDVENLVGKKYNNWTVLEYVGKSESRNSRWLCECDCENKTRKIVTDNNLKQGNSSSCGCNNPRGTTHGKSRTKDVIDRKIYRAWSSMRGRCNNSNDINYHHYGGRGIRVCDEWNNVQDGFMNFYNWSIINGIARDLSIDRIDNNGNYEPSNCRWTTYKVQNNNRSDNRNYTIKGITKSLSLWSEEYKVTPHNFKKMIEEGVIEEDYYIYRNK